MRREATKVETRRKEVEARRKEVEARSKEAKARGVEVTIGVVKGDCESYYLLPQGEKTLTEAFGVQPTAPVPLVRLVGHLPWH